MIQRGIPGPYEPEPIVEPMTPERFVELLAEYIYAFLDKQSTMREREVARVALVDAVRDVFGRLAT